MQYEVDVEVVQFAVDVVEFLTSVVGLAYIWFPNFALPGSSLDTINLVSPVTKVCLSEFLVLL